MTKKCATSKKAVDANTKMYVCVSCNVLMRLEPSCRGLSQVAVKGMMELGHLAMLLCNNFVSSIERDNFIRCRTIEEMSVKIKAHTKELKERLPKMETLLAACVDTSRQCHHSNMRESGQKRR